MNREGGILIAGNNGCILKRHAIKTTALICLLLCSGLVSAAEPAPGNASFKPDGRHICEINAEHTLLLAENGKACAEIVVARPGSPAAAFAARELKTFLDQATGADFKIVHERSGDLPAIFVGDSEWIRSWGVDVNTLARDGFIIRRVKDTIVIAGRDDPYVVPEQDLRHLYERGTIFGVYDFLERFLGVRFYFPGEIGTVVPRSASLRVPAMNIVEEPDFSMRNVSWEYVGWPDPQERLRQLREEIFRLRGQTQYIPNCHGLGRLGYLDRFGQTHPEYFVLYPDGKRGNDASRPGHLGQLCFSNTNLEDEVYKDAEAFLTGKPASIRGVTFGDKKIPAWDWNACMPGYFNAMPQDGCTPCHCPQCKPFFDNKRAGDLVWGFICRIAQRLKKNGVPGYITNIAYPPCTEVPAMEIPDNVLVMVAGGGPWREKNPLMQEKADKLIRDWQAKLGHKVWLWNYMNNYNGSVPAGVPPLSTKWVASYYKRNAPYITGAFIESEMDHFLFNYLNWYVFMKTAWDLSTDTGKLLAEHHQKLFGPAAEPMGRFFARLEEIWTSELVGEARETDLGPVYLKPSELKTWEKVYNEERINEFEKLFDEAEKLAGKDADSLKRVKFFREKLFGEMLKAREAYVKRKREIEDLVFEVTPLPEGRSITVDGMLNEPAWQNAAEVLLISAEENKPALVKTRVRALWTAKNLYLGFDCEEPQADKMAVMERKRDDPDMWRDTSVEVFLNPSNDRANYFQFVMNANGNIADLAYQKKDEVTVADLGWSPDVRSAAKVQTNSWTAEIAIPLEKIVPGGGLKAGDTMIANFNRSRYIRGGKPEENQLFTWSPFIKDSFHRLDRFGRMRFVETKGTNLSLLKNGSFEIAGPQGLPADWFFSEEERKRFALDDYFSRDGVRNVKIAAAETVKACATQWISGMKPNTQ